MRYALIDNSTLTGIQRLLGEIFIKNKFIIDNDILDLENYLQAILFYDQSICIDDYKEDFSGKRKDYFSNIRFISKELFDYEKFVTAANEVTKDISLEINSGKISDDDFKSYFDKLNMTFQFTWDLSSSKFFLTQKMLKGNSILNEDHFSKLHSLLFKENNETHEVEFNFKNKPPRLIESNGNEIDLDEDKWRTKNSSKGDGLSPQFQALVSSLNWISQRTAFYVLLADYLYSDLFIQPLRQSFLQNIIRRVYPDYQLGVFNDFRNSINSGTQETLKDILENSDNFNISVDIPLFSAYFAKKTNDPTKIIEAALEERESKNFKEVRDKLRELNVILDNSENRKKFIRKINLLVKEINDNFSRIEREYGLGEKQGFGISHLKFLFSEVPILNKIQIPQEWDARIKSLEFMKHLKPKKGFNAVYRNVIEELLEFDKLGKYKDILIKNVEFHREAEAYSIKTEDIKFLNKSSYWKKPM